MSDPGVIWLQPWCDGCEKHAYPGEGRLWCTNDEWGECPADECQQKPVKYVRADLMEAGDAGTDG